MWAGSVVSLLWGHRKVLLIVAALSAWTVYQRHDAASRCQDRHLAAQLRERDAQLDRAETVAREARAQADQTQREMQELEAIRDEILARPGAGPACVVPDDLRRRLLSIR